VSKLIEGMPGLRELHNRGDQGTGYGRLTEHCGLVGIAIMRDVRQVLILVPPFERRQDAQQYQSAAEYERDQEQPNLRINDTYLCCIILPCFAHLCWLRAGLVQRHGNELKL
jgi:hypothetical protein